MNENNRLHRFILPHQGFASGSRTASVPYKRNNLDDKVELSGTFCMGKCQQGVCVTVDDKFFSVKPDTVKDFFSENVLAKV